MSELPEFKEDNLEFNFEDGRPSITQIDLRDILDTHDLIPQAIINKPIENIAREQGYSLHRGADDLDEYEGIGLSLEDSVPFAVMRYKGRPEGTFTIYLPRDVCGLDEITKDLSKIIHLLGVPNKLIEWQRKDDPDL